MRSRAVDASIVLILRQDVVHYAAAGNCGRFNHRSKTLLIKYGTKYGSTFVLKGTKVLSYVVRKYNVLSYFRTEISYHKIVVPS